MYLKKKNVNFVKNKIGQLIWLDHVIVKEINNMFILYVFKMKLNPILWIIIEDNL